MGNMSQRIGKTVLCKLIAQTYSTFAGENETKEKETKTK